MNTRRKLKYHIVCHNITKLIKSANELFNIDKRLSTYRMIAMFRLISKNWNIIRTYQKNNEFLCGIVAFCLDSQNVKMLQRYSTPAQFRFCKKQIKQIVGRESYYLLF